jgi:hypothetical protein
MFGGVVSVLIGRGLCITRFEIDQTGGSRDWGLLELTEELLALDDSKM